MKSLLITSILTMSLMLPSAQAKSVWINELHYDNAGTDVGEFIEIAGLASTNLTDWSLQLFNGSNNSIYKTLSLTNYVIDNEHSGYGAVAIELPSNGIQNGNADGIALVDHTDSIIQFLSYEGSLTIGSLTSQDIGVEENANTPANFSLQLQGIGNSYYDFSWSNPSTNSKGSLNTNQFISSVPEPASYLIFLLGLSILSATLARRNHFKLLRN